MAHSGNHQFWQGEFVRVVLPSLLSVLLFTWVVFFYILPNLRSQLTDRKLELIRELTNAAVSTLEIYERKAAKGGLSLPQAQAEALEHLRHMRYGPNGKDYFWVSDLHARVIMHPYRPDLEGKVLQDFHDVEGIRPFREFAKTARKNGEGYVPYHWQWKDDPSRIAAKLSYVKLFKPWGWVVGTGIYVDDVEKEVGIMTSRLGWMSLIVLLVVGMLAAYVAYEGLRSEKSRRLAELEVRAGQERYHSVMEASAEPLVIYNLQGRVEYCNPAFTRVFGWTREELLGRKVEFVPPDEQGPTMGVIRRVLAGVSCREFETRRLTRDGRVLQIIISAAMFRDGAGEPSGMVVNLRDVTEKQQLEQQLQHAQKMEAIGTLAGGVAHEFNNLIMAVQGYTELLTRHEHLDSFTRDYLGKIEGSCRRAADLTRKMLTFSRLEVGRKEAVDLNQLVEGVRELLGRTAPRRITLETMLAVELPPVLAQAPLLEQVLVNLGINACDAIPGPGTIIFRTQVVYHSVEFCQANPWAHPGRNVQVQVEDDGQGIPPEILERIFDPFFTTKEPGRGTGLGLSVAYSIVGRLAGTSAPTAGRAGEACSPSGCRLWKAKRPPPRRGKRLP